MKQILGGGGIFFFLDQGNSLQMFKPHYMSYLLRLRDMSPTRSKRQDPGTRVPVTQLSPGSGALSSYGYYCG